MVWTAEEKKAYIAPVRHPLSSLYIHARISAQDPERRAEYLAEKVLKLTATDHDLVMRTAKDEGRANALHRLENWFLSSVRAEESFIEAILQQGGEVELRMPHFALGGYADAHYSFSGPIIELEGSYDYGFPASKKVRVPSQVQVLTNKGTWESFPIVFLHSNDRKGEHNSLVIFKADGSYYHTQTIDKLLFSNAEAKGLTRGSRADIQIFIREEE